MQTVMSPDTIDTKPEPQADSMIDTEPQEQSHVAAPWPPDLLTVIIPCFRDQAFLYCTIQNILDSAKRATGFKIIVVDDANEPALFRPRFDSTISIEWIRNVQREGCAACRMIGAKQANTPFLLFCDSHMRFPEGWFQSWLDYKQKKTEILNATFASHDITGKLQATRHGAKLYFWHKENNRLKVFDMRPINPEPDAPKRILRSVMVGASYFVPADWFRHVRGFGGLKYWGCDEELLSIKTYLAGGTVSVMRDLTIGHINTDPLYSGTGRTGRDWLLYNKLVTGFLTLPDNQWELFLHFVATHSPASLAYEHFKTAEPWLLAERQALREIYSRSIESYCAQFEIVGMDDIGACQF